MRMLLSTDAVGGVWDHAVTLARHLVRGGHDVMLAVLGRPNPARLSELPRGLRWESLSLPLEWMEGGLERIAEAGVWLDGLAVQAGAEVVHLNQLTYAPAISRPTVVAVHGDAWSWFGHVRDAPPPEPRWEEYRRAVARGLIAADLVVAPSTYQSELTGRHYGRAADRSVWNGIDPWVPDPAPARARWRRTDPDRTGGRRPILVSIGRAWDEAKGLHVLERALRILGRPWTAYLAGDTEGPDGQRFDARRLLPLGRLDKRQVWRLLGEADVYVGASLYEPFGLAVVEAASAGCALVLSDIGSFREIWGEDAVFFPRGDPHALARALALLAADPERRHELAARARRRAIERLCARRMTEEYLQIYRSLRRPSACGTRAFARGTG